MIQSIPLTRFDCRQCQILEKTDSRMTLRANEEGMCLTLLTDSIGIGGVDWTRAKYVVMDITALEPHSMVFGFQYFAKYTPEDGPYDMRTTWSLLPNFKTHFVLPLQILNSQRLHITRTPGRLKLGVHGKPLKVEDIRRVDLISTPCFHKALVLIENLRITDEEPVCTIPDRVQVDEIGQLIDKQWPEKLSGLPAATEYLQKLLQEAKAFSFQYPEGYSRFGGWKKLSFEATGYFRTQHDGKRWWLVDPEGCAFLSIGPDCVGGDRSTYIPDMQSTYAWLPSFDDPQFAPCWKYGHAYSNFIQENIPAEFDFPAANLIRAYGPTWYEDWALTVKMRLYQWGCNTVGNWSDTRLYSLLKMPYVHPMGDFPETKTPIFRDFPDTLSREYREKSVVFAQQLVSFAGDENMIGYFMRNEPSWAFMADLLIAEEMLANPHPFESKEILIAELREKYGTIEALNAAWAQDFASFDDLRRPVFRPSSKSQAAHDDLRLFSIKMITAYVEIPAKACKAVDPNHLNLGMRWAMIHNLDLLSGSQFLDVFSMNRYADTPAPAIDDFMTKLNMPLLIGEFHFGAIDKGMCATGQYGSLNQLERGKAYRYYIESAMAKPVCVGAHYFTYNDQGPMGRTDGENYQHGIVDCCQQPYEDFVSVMTPCNFQLYSVANGDTPPTQERAIEIPRIN